MKNFGLENLGLTFGRIPPDNWLIKRLDEDRQLLTGALTIKLPSFS